MIAKGILFGETHSFDDLDLILSACDIPPAQPKTTYVTIAGADGSVDLTEANGEVRFSDRDCTFTFTMNPSGDLSVAAYEEKKTEVSNLLNGREFKITLDKDEDFYYQGRCTVDSYKSDGRIREIVVSAKVKPYKYKQSVTAVAIDLTSTPKTMNIANSRKSVVPEVTCTANNTVVMFGGATFNLSAGTHKILDIQFVEGNNAVTVSGTGTVTFKFQEAEL